jgi:bifunctional UDP-N-acetylglucosamine pyrophosphorylase / glucosamine-1-phosphate N-acetyltransferase
MAIQVVILAAGQGKRMYSKHPKVLHTLGGKPLLQHVITAALSISPHLSPIIVYGHLGERLREAMTHHQVHWVEQTQQLGTGHALMQALSAIKEDDQVLVLYGDVPLISPLTLNQLIETTPKDAIGMLTANIANPTGYGRIKRDKQHRVIGIVEEKEATDKERAITEINPGIYLIPAIYLKKWLPALKNQNAQGEYYLTDIISFAVKEDVPVHTLTTHVPEEILGVNDRVQLAHLERFYQLKWAEKLMRQGVTLYDPARFDVRGDVQVGHNVTIDVNVILEGHVVIEDDCVIGPHTLLRNTRLGQGVEIKAHSVLDGADIGAGSKIGPFAHLRPGSVLATDVRIGNFVEVKNSKINEKSKVNHLSYVGDSDIGKSVNVGAGTITCNYDGVNKHRTIIGDNAFIGSNSQLVAPVMIGAGATIGAGSTITKDAPPYKLTLSRAPQTTIEEWERPVKKGG